GTDRLQFVGGAGVRVEFVDGDLRILGLEASNHVTIAAPAVRQSDRGQHALGLCGGLEFAKILSRQNRGRYLQRGGGQRQRGSRAFEHFCLSVFLTPVDASDAVTAVV